MGVDTDLFRIELAKRRLTRIEVARVLGVPATTLGAWVRGVHPAPTDLPARIEKALGLAAGTLTKKPEREQ